MTIDIFDNSTPEPGFEGLSVEEIIMALDDYEQECEDNGAPTGYTFPHPDFPTGY